MNIHLPQCEAPKIAKLVYNSNNYGLWMFMVFITIVTRSYKPTYILGASHCGVSPAEVACPKNAKGVDVPSGCTCNLALTGSNMRDLL